MSSGKMKAGSRKATPNLQGLPPLPAVVRRGGPSRKSGKGGWTPEEDDILRRAVAQHGGKNWKKIAEYFENRSDVQCLHRWQKVLDPNLFKGPWTPEEDKEILKLVEVYGPHRWSLIAQNMPGRIGKQCRERSFDWLMEGLFIRGQLLGKKHEVVIHTCWHDNAQ